MKKNLGAVLALYPTPAIVAGVMAGGKPTWLLMTHIGVPSHHHLMLSMAKPHHTNQFVKAEKVVSINLVDEALLPRADKCGFVSGAKEDKSGVFAWHPGAIGAPLIDDAPVSIECSVEDCYELDGFDNFMCRIVNTFAEERVLDAAGKLDYDKIGTVLFEFPTYSYLRSSPVFAKCGAPRKSLEG